MPEELYVISDEGNSERYVKSFADMREARTWAQNHLDMSRSWNCDRLEWLVTNAYENVARKLQA